MQLTAPQQISQEQTMSRTNSLSVSVSVCVCVCLFLSVFVSVCVCVCLSAYLPVCLSVSLCLSDNTGQRISQEWTQLTPPSLSAYASFSLSLLTDLFLPLSRKQTSLLLFLSAVHCITVMAVCLYSTGKKRKKKELVRKDGSNELPTSLEHAAEIALPAEVNTNPVWFR